MIDKKSLINFFTKLKLKAKENYGAFNSIDGKLGDGDLGITILKGIEEINKNYEEFEEHLDKIFLLCAKLFTKVSSSSFGTLTALSFMALAKEYKDKKQIENIDILIGIKKIIETISLRGKSNIGDKTILDSLNEVVLFLEESDEGDIGFKVYKASKNALDKFKGKECKIGRARMFSEKSKDLDDPGMYAFYKLSSIFKNN